MKINREISCNLDIDACDTAEMVANSDAKEQADFFYHLVYNFDSFPIMDKDIQIAHLVDNLFMDDSEKDVRRFLEKMLSWFDYYEKEYGEE